MVRGRELLALLALLAAPVVAAAKGDDRPMKLMVFSEECYDKMLVKGDFFDGPCMKQVVSKCLGYAIVVGSGILKVPQIAKIVSSGSCAGLSPMAVYLDLAAFMPTPVYNILHGFPFSTYGEGVIIMVQNAVIVLLLWAYSPDRPSLGAMLGITAFFAVAGAGSFGLPEDLWWGLPVISILFTIWCRMSQILQNFSAGHTGQLSLITWLLNAVGAVARVFTTLQEVDDVFILASFIIGAVLSGTVVFQIIIYWKATTRFVTKAKKE